MDFAHCVAVKCICVFLFFPEVQKVYVFRYCALCMTGSSQGSVFETDIVIDIFSRGLIRTSQFNHAAA